MGDQFIKVVILFCRTLVRIWDLILNMRGSQLFTLYWNFSDSCVKNSLWNRGRARMKVIYQKGDDETSPGYRLFRYIFPSQRTYPLIGWSTAENIISKMTEFCFEHLDEWACCFPRWRQMKEGANVACHVQVPIDT